MTEPNDSSVGASVVVTVEITVDNENLTQSVLATVDDRANLDAISRESLLATAVKGLRAATASVQAEMDGAGLATIVYLAPDETGEPDS